MSGKCTGWVGEHGPHPDDVDRTGKKYGARARGLRLVLLAVADSANVDGRHSHPGIAGVAKFSLYSAGQARRLLDELEAEGWLIVEEQGGGRLHGPRIDATPKGRATVYRVPMDDASHPVLLRRASCAPSAGPNARVAPPDSRAPAPDTRAPRPDTRAPGCAPNGVPNGVTNGVPNAADEPPAAAPSPAQGIAQAVWDARDPKPAIPFVAVVKLAQRFVDAGWAPDAITAAMSAVPHISTGWVESELNRRRPTPSRRPTEDRDAPTGRITDL